MPGLLLVKAVLELRTPGGVAAPEQLSAPDHVDLPLARIPTTDPGRKGRVFVPASSLAGAFRAHLGQRADVLMGPPPDVRDDQVAASPLRFLGTTVQPAGIVRRMRTAVDRQSGAAAAGTLHSSELLSPDSRITAYLCLDAPSLSAELVDRLCDWRPTVGHGRSSGQGRAEVVELRQRLVDLDTAEGRRAWLLSGGPEMFADSVTTRVPIPTRQPESPLLRMRWRVVDGLHVGSGERRERGDATAVTLVVRDHDGRPHVPGTTWKGMLRARCEFILRSLGMPACAPGVGLAQEGAGPTGACGRCLVCMAFGFTGRGDDEPSRRGLLDFADSPIEEAEVVLQTHAPQDRVFGGAADGLLHTAEVVRDGHLTLDVCARQGDLDPAIHALLTLACHDLHHGFAGVGGATTRGLGTLRLIGEPHELAAQREQAVATLVTAVRESSTAEED